MSQVAVIDAPVMRPLVTPQLAAYRRWGAAQPLGDRPHAQAAGM
jgi:hypothetical protein